MTKLFKFEYRRLFRQKSFWIFMAVAAALAFLSLGAFKLIEIATNITSDMKDVDTYFGIGYTGAEAFRNATSLGDIDIVIAIVAAIFVCSEYSRGTIKTVVSAGFSRCKIFTAEFLVSMTAAALVFVASSVSAFVFGSIFWGIGKFNAELWNAVLLQLLIVLSLTAIIYMFSKAVKKTAAAIAFGIFAPQITALLLKIADAAIDSEKFRLSDYWLSGCLSDVQATSPLNMNIFDIINGTSANLTSELAIRVIAVSAVYMAAAFVFGIIIFRRQEI